jgi:hypothetical protein
MSPFGENDIHLRLTPVFAHNTQVGSYVKTLLHVDAHDLKFSENATGSHRATIEVVIATFDEDGIPVDLTSRTLPLELNDQDYKACLERGALFTLTHKVKRAGAYQFRAAVRDADSNRLGSANQFIQIPDLHKKRIALSGIVLGENRAVSVAKTAAGEIEVPGNGWPARVFHPGTDLAYTYEVLNARRDEKTQAPDVEVQIRLLRDGKEIYLSEARRASTAGVEGPGYFAVGGAFHLGNKMPVGSYVLQVIASDALAPKKHQTANQWIDFEVAE